MKWDGKSISLLLTLMNQLTMSRLATAPRILILGSSSNVLQLLCFVYLLAQGWLKDWDNGNMQLGRVSLLYFSSSKWDP
jgi:hypothetical protein